ncbi:MAG: ComEC/Rec2 family competence protein [Planctomycetia bacterium]|nr:ComEC/Rec2 family competence protein [Planctomycetia bacterium]
MARPALPLLAVSGVLAGFLAVHAGPAGVVGAGIVLVAATLPAARGGRPLALAGLLGLVAAARGAAAPATDALAPRLPDEGVRAVVEGTVVDADPPSPAGVPFVLETTAVTTAAGREEGRARLRASGGGPGAGRPFPALHPGDRVTVSGTLRRLPSPTNPGAFDAREAWARRGVFARLDVPDGTCVEALRPSEGLLAAVSHLRGDVAARLTRAVGPADAGLLRSLLVGDRGALDPADRVRFVRAGAAHILAISGAHVALVVAGLLRVLRALRVPRRAAAAGVLVGVALLVPLTGASPPVVRSAAGFGLFLVGRLLGREPRGGLLLATVAVGYLAIDPTAASDPGFRMSFAAAAGLVLLAGRLRHALVGERLVDALHGGPPPSAPVRSALAAGLAAWAASTPVTVHDLGQSGWVAIPVGLVAVPLSTAAMLAGLAAVAVADAPGLGALARVAVEVTLGALRTCLDAPVRVGVSQGPVVAPGALWYVAYGLAFLAAARAAPRLALAGGAAMAVLLASLPADHDAAPPPHVRLTLLDVGHGQAALLETPDGARALLDAGSRDRPDVADRVVLPALRVFGVPALDLVVASHADADHAGALPAVAEVVPVRLAVVPPRFAPATRDAIVARVGAVLEAADGDELLSGDWGRLVVRGPARAPPADASENDGCLVLALETPHGTVLLPGDREEDGVADLLAAHPDLAADVLVSPHHGLPAPSRERLRAAVRPRVEVASAPASVAATLPPTAWVTGRDGAVTITLGPDGPTVVAFAPRRPVDVPSGDPGPADARPAGPRPYDPTRPAMPDVPTLALAVVVLAVIVAASIRLGWLRPSAALAAGVLGLLAVAAFAWAGLAALLAPFLVATLLGKLPGGLEAGGPRVLRQVLANGLPGAVGLAFAAAGVEGAAAAFAGAFAALGADTLATEIGTRYGGTPRHALTFRPLPRGASGGVSLAGTLASFVGAALAPVAMAAAGGLPRGAVVAAAAGGVVAGLADSALGAVLQRKGTCATCGRVVEEAVCCGAPPARLRGRLAFLDNDAVNLVNGVVGALVAFALARGSLA